MNNTAVFVQAQNDLYGYLPILISELSSLGNEFSDVAKEVLEDNGFPVPKDYLSNENYDTTDAVQNGFQGYEVSDVDIFSDNVMMNSTLTNIENDAIADDGDWQNAWEASGLDNILDPESFEMSTDQFDEYDDDDEDMPPLAEQQEDIAPSDPVALEQLTNSIASDAAEEDENLTGGITDVKRTGVEDANMEGPIEQNSENVHPVTQPNQDVNGQENDVKDDNERHQSQVTNANSLEKSDFVGDIDQDTAIQSALSVSQDDFNNHISPFIPSQKLNSEESRNGVSANLNEDVIKQAYVSYTNFTNSLSSSFAQLNNTYIDVKNVENELMNIDNISLMRLMLLTPTERVNKVSNRISRLQGTNKLLADNIVRTIEANKKGPLVAPMLALFSLSENMISALNMIKKEPTNDEPLKYIETFISPNLTFLAMTIEKLRIKQEIADSRAKSSFATIVSAYQNADSSERDISKVLRYDVDTSPSYSPFAKQMQKEFNHDIQSSLILQRKIRSKLLATTNMSAHNTNKVIDHRTLKQDVKQAVNTMKINTDNITQRYPRLPFSTKTNSRRLNLLETPLAVKNRKSVPYINEFNKSKLLFS